MGLNLDLCHDEPVQIERAGVRGFFRFRPIDKKNIEVEYFGKFLLTDESGRKVGGKFSVESGKFLEFETDGDQGFMDLYTRGSRVRVKFTAPPSFIINARTRNQKNERNED